MEWLKHGWETQWMHTRNWPGSMTPKELRKRLQSMEKLGKTPSGSGKQAKEHMMLYMQELSLSLFAAAKWEEEHIAGDEETAVYFSLLYNADLSKYLEAYMQHPIGVEESEINDLTLHAAAFLIDQTKLVLRSLAESPKTEPRRVSQGVDLLRTLCAAVDVRTPYHEQHADMPLPDWLPSHPFRKFTNAATSSGYCGRSTQESHGEFQSGLCTRMADLKLMRDQQQENYENHADEQNTSSSPSCKCSECRPRRFLRIKVLLEYFGKGSAIPGCQLLVSLLYGTVSARAR